MEYWLLVLFVISSLFSKATIGFRDGMSSIVGGQYAGKKTVTQNGIEYLTTKEFPYMVAIEYFGDYECGGSILSTNRVLTAAHCVKGKCKFALKVRAGTFIRGSSTDTYKQKVGVKSVKVHEEYRKKIEIPDYDIAILKLSGNFVFNDYVNNIQLPTGLEHEDLEKQKAIVLGFGVTQTKKMSKYLKKAHVVIIFEGDCNNMVPFPSSHTMICTMGDEQPSAVCDGDSGGPLIIRHNARNPTEDILIGIVSFSQPPDDVYVGVPCDPNQPSVYTDVRDHLKWIKDRM